MPPKAPPPPPPKTGTVNRSAAAAPRTNAAPPRNYSSSSSSTPSRPIATQRGYDGQIRFADDEIKRMHAELERRERDRASKLPRPQSTTRGTKSRKSGMSVTGFLLRVAVFYVLIAYYFVCPTDEARERAVCRQLDVFSANLQSLEPHARPYLDFAHRQAEPYLAEFHKRTEPYIAKARPIYAKADSYIEPVTNKLSQVYDSYVYPGIVKGIHATQAAARPVAARAHEQYQRSLAPSVEWYSRAGQDWYKSNAERHVATADRVIRTSSKRAFDFVAPAVPFAHHHFWNTLVPTTQSTYKTSHETYFSHVHPQVVVARGHALQFWRTRIVPALHRFYELYIAPQVDKISERVLVYKSKKTTAEEEARAEAAEAERVESKDEDVFADFIAEPLEQVPIVETSSESAEEVAAEDVVEDVAVDEEQDTSAAERAEVEALQDKYDQEVAELGQAQFEHVATRLAALRSQIASDITKKIEPSLLKLRWESNKLADELTDFLTRDDGRTKEQKLDMGQQFRTVVMGKSKQAADGVRTEANKLARMLKLSEKKIVTQASQAIEEKVTHAQNDVGQRWTYLQSTTTQDWERYHRLLAAQKKWQADYEGLQSGKVANTKLGKARPLELLHDVQGRIESALQSLEEVLELRTQKAMTSLPGTVVEPEVEAGQDAQDAVVDSQEGLAASAVSMAALARESASSIFAAVAHAMPTASATSVVEQVQSVPTNVVDRAVSAADRAAASVKSYLGDASQAALNAVGIDPSPTDVSQTATYVAKQAKKTVTSVASVVSETLVNELPSSASSLAAAATETIGSIADEATSTVASVASNVASAASEATQIVAESVASAASIVSSFVAPATATPIIEQITSTIADVASQASSVIHDATRTTAEGVSETVSSFASVVKSAVLEHVEL